MGTREDLLAAAKKCLADRGYARTTVRDIVAVSDTNLAAINYHFGTREALLTQAMTEVVADAVATITAAVPGPDKANVASRLRLVWTTLTESFAADRDLWLANVEALTVALRNPELRAHVTAGHRTARTRLAEGLHAGETVGTRGSEAEVGVVVLTLLNGLLMQWAVDPENAPTPQEINTGLFALTKEWTSG